MSKIQVLTLTIEITADADDITDAQADKLIETLERAVTGVRYTMRKAFIKHDIDTGRVTVS